MTGEFAMLCSSGAMSAGKGGRSGQKTAAPVSLGERKERRRVSRDLGRGGNQPGVSSFELPGPE